MVEWHILDSGGDEIDKREFDNVPSVGDMIDIAKDDEVELYTVTKVYRHFGVHNDVTFRIDVSFSGQPFISVF